MKIGDKVQTPKRNLTGFIIEIKLDKVKVTFNPFYALATDQPTWFELKEVILI